MKTISRYIMTLALLLTAVTGAWAQSYEAKVFDVPASWTEDETYLSAADLPKDFVQITKDEAKALAVPDGIVLLIYGFVGDNVLMMPFENGTSIPDDDDDGAPEARGMFIVFLQQQAKICYTAPGGPKVAWNPSTKTGNFSMPGSDVVLTPIYAKAAAFATTGTEPDVKTQLPEAAEGVIAGTDASLIADGTGIVAFAGESTTVTQGTVMYAVTTTADAAPALTAFSATVPTAKDYDDATTLYVWYYIQGQDTPDGQQATEENTFNDSEISATPLTVQVLTNKFDIQFTAANDNTIQAGKATVTVDGTAATVTDGKLQGVKMGSEVKMTAQPGYKFRKVEVKKKEALIVNPVVGQVIGSDGKNYAADATLPDGVTKVAMIAYVDGSNGLAIALADEGSKNWATAISTCEAKTPALTNGTWKLPTRDEWKQMFAANGGNDGNYNGLNNALAAAGGGSSKLEGFAWYWSSSQYDGEAAYGLFLNSGSAGWFDVEKGESYHVRACLAF